MIAERVLEKIQAGIILNEQFSTEEMGGGMKSTVKRGDQTRIKESARREGSWLGKNSERRKGSWLGKQSARREGAG